MKTGASLVLAGLLTCVAGMSLAGPAPTPADLDSLRVLLKQGHFAAAESGARSAIQDLLAKSGSDSTDAAPLLDLLVEALWRGDHPGAPETRRLAEATLRIRERPPGSDPPGLAASLFNLAGILYSTVDAAGARDLLERSLRIREAALGPDHPDVARTLGLLVLCHRRQGDLPGALPLAERAAAIRTRALAPDDPDLAISLHSLANLDRDLGRYAAAVPLYERALAIWEGAPDGPDPNAAYALSNMAQLYQETGDFAKATVLYERALAIRRERLGADHPLSIQSLSNLGSVRYVDGDYTGARTLLEEALHRQEASPDSDPGFMAVLLHNLGKIAGSTGEYDRALELFERALKIRESLHGAEDEVAWNLLEIANLRRETGQLAEARPFYERAIGIWDRGTRHGRRGLGDGLVDFADLLHATGQDSLAAVMFERGLAIAEQDYGSNHLYTAIYLQKFADFLADRREWNRAQLNYERALAIREKTLGPDHPDVAEALVGLARVRGAPGFGGALDDALRAEAIGRRHLTLTIRALSERQALQYASIRPEGLDLALSVIATGGAGAPAADNARVLDSLIRSRALVFDEMASRRRMDPADGDSVASRLAASTLASRQRLAHLLMRGSGDLPPERFRALVDSAGAECEALEQALAVRSARFREAGERNRIGLNEVAEALPPGSALVSYVRVEEPRPEGRYIAMVLGPVDGPPRALDLGDAAAIDSLAALWRDEAGRPPDAGDPGAAEARCNRVGDALRSRIWDPMADSPGAARVFVVPDGALNLVSFAALPAKEGGYLAEGSPVFHYLSAERDLVPAGTEAPGDGLLALGDPDFDAIPVAPGARSAGKSPVPGGTAAPAFRGESPACGEFRDIRWERLPGTEREVEDVAQLWRKDAGERAGRDVDELKGAAAGEAAFKRLAPGRRVLHVATHGFFLDGECASTTSGTRGVGGLVAARRPQVAGSTGASAARVAPAPFENPLRLSGLVLAGANRRDSPAPDGEDDILTAEEVSALNLDGVEWAVLSACETGVGEIKAGEGVFGLRRAFQIAGAGTLIMSLWPLEDESARDWMRDLYTARLRDRLGTAEAMRAASLDILRARRARHESTHPFFWGAFVAAGDWR